LLILGEPGACPIWGINGFTEDHEAFLKTWTGKDLVLCLDSDEAGKAAATALGARLAAFSPRVVDLSPYKDPNELLSRAQDPKAEWARLVDSKDAAKEETQLQDGAGPRAIEGDGLSFL
jgi:DNA primase